MPEYLGTAQQQISADIILAISNWVDSISVNRGTASSDPGTSQCMPVMTRSMRARPVPPMPVAEQQVPEDPMSVHEPVVPEDLMWVDTPVEPTPDDPMPVDEPIFPERLVPDWAQKFMAYLVDGILPSEEVEARQIVRRAKSFTIINKERYKRSVTGKIGRASCRERVCQYV